MRHTREIIEKEFWSSHAIREVPDDPSGNDKRWSAMETKTAGSERGEILEELGAIQRMRPIFP